jgi:hypothetical protein
MSEEGGRWTSAQEATRTYSCRTPSCPNPATKFGRGVYCRECRQRRANDRLPAEIREQFPVLTADHADNVGDVVQSVEAPERNGRPADNGVAVPSHNRYSERRSAQLDAPPTKLATPLQSSSSVRQQTGPMEASALRLAAAGRELDAALGEYARLKPRITAALQGWRDAVAQLPHATNGHAPN